MDEFKIYLHLGFQHITDITGYDHILFIVALCAIYQLADWRQLLILVTAFTIGHSITLALAALNIIRVNALLVEFLIPVTIIVTALSNLVQKPAKQVAFGGIRYWLAAIFGLIHGMGFSNYLRSLLGKDAQIIKQLFAFNIGLEIGQLVIVIATLVLGLLVIRLAQIKYPQWTLWISGVVTGAAFVLMTQKWYF